MPKLLLQPIYAVLYLALQATLFGQMIVFGVALPQIYLLFLIMLPMQLNLGWSLLVAFFYGLSYDLLTQTAATGVGSFAAVFLIALKELWIQASVPKIYYSTREDLDFQSLPLNHMLFYMIPLLFFHQIIFYWVDSFGMDGFWMVLLKSFSGTLYTGLLSVLILVLFYSGKKK
jgi:hypothetical protein